MKSRLLLIPAIVATTAGLGVSSNALSSQPDAQAHAAALLSPTHERVPESAREQGNASSQSVGVDAHAHAAALLRGRRTGQEAKALEQIAASSAARDSLDAQAHAAALLSGRRITLGEGARITAANEKLGEHPAVLVAQAGSAHRIDPNTFIVAHPAGLRLVAASPSEDAQRAVARATASTGANAAAPNQERIAGGRARQ